MSNLRTVAKFIKILILSILLSVSIGSHAFGQLESIQGPSFQNPNFSSRLWPSLHQGEIFQRNSCDFTSNNFLDPEKKPLRANDSVINNVSFDFAKGNENFAKEIENVAKEKESLGSFSNPEEMESRVSVMNMSKTLENIPLHSECSSTDGSLYFSQEIISQSNETSIIRGGIGSLPKLRSLSVWGNGYWGGGNISPRNLSYSLDNDIKGAMVGLNMKFRGNFTFSAYYNYNLGELETPGWQDKQTTNMAGMSLYYQLGNIYFTLLGSGGVDSYEYKKPSQADPLNFDGYQLNGYFEIGGKMSTGGLFTLRPFTSILYNYISQDGYDTGRYVLFEDVEKKMSSFDYLAGARIDISPGSEMFTFQVRGSWVHQMDDGGDSINTFFMGRIPGAITPSQYFFEGYHGSDFFWGGAGVRFSMFNKLSLTLDYDLLTNKKQASQFGNLGLLYHF